MQQPATRAIPAAGDVNIQHAVTRHMLSKEWQCRLYGHMMHHLLSLHSATYRLADGSAAVPTKPKRWFSCR
jgi:hypothetical protein